MWVIIDVMKKIIRNMIESNPRRPFKTGLSEKVSLRKIFESGTQGMRMCRLSEELVNRYSRQSEQVPKPGGEGAWSAPQQRAAALNGRWEMGEREAGDSVCCSLWGCFYKQWAASKQLFGGNDTD